MRDEQYGSNQLIDVSAIPLHLLQEMDSAALRAALSSCLVDDKVQIASFGNTI